MDNGCRHTENKGHHRPRSWCYGYAPSASLAQTKPMGAMRPLRNVRQWQGLAQPRASSATCWQNGSVQGV